MKAKILTGTLIFLFSSCGHEDGGSKVDAMDSQSKAAESLDSTSKSDLMDLTDSTAFSVIELNSLNSNHFSKEKVKAERNRIFDLALSKEHKNWKNPTSGGAAHINEKDEIVVYNSAFIFDSTNYRSKVIKAGDVWHYVQGYTYGNAPCVLITCEFDTKKSKSLPAVIDEMVVSHKVCQLIFFFALTKRGAKRKTRVGLGHSVFKNN